MYICKCLYELKYFVWYTHVYKYVFKYVCMYEYKSFMYVCTYVCEYVCRHIYFNQSSVKFFVHRIARTPRSFDLCRPTAPNCTKVPLKYGTVNGLFCLDPSIGSDELATLSSQLSLLLFSSFRRKKNLLSLLIPTTTTRRIVTSKGNGEESILLSLHAPTSLNRHYCNR